MKRPAHAALTERQREVLLKAAELPGQSRLYRSSVEHPIGTVGDGSPGWFYPRHVEPGCSPVLVQLIGKGLVESDPPLGRHTTYAYRVTYAGHARAHQLRADRDLAPEVVDLHTLRLSTRAHNALRRAGFHRVEQLRRAEIGELAELRGFGVGSLAEVLTALKKVSA
ncbi:hypothetical protein SEA_ZENTENO07_68 [Mycobacterium phage Zenteno07]|nr:hypothetical protein SEA_ZENTENO07_68 [Mycobacterium phage Zenteno07]